MNTLSDGEISRVLSGSATWSLQDGVLFWQRRFTDFAAAFAFLTRVALLAEKRDHHPDIELSYNTLELRLVSHDAGGVTQRDLDMAVAIDALGTA